MSNFIFLTNNELNSYGILASSENILNKSFYRKFISNNSALNTVSLIDSPDDYDDSKLFTIMAQTSGVIEGNATFIIKDDLTSSSWYGINYINSPIGDVIKFEEAVYNVRYTSDGTNLYAIGLKGDTTSSDLYFYIFDDSSNLFINMSQINDYMDGYVKLGVLLYENNGFYCIFAKTDDAGQCVIKFSSDGTSWSKISEFELCSYSENINTLDAEIAGGQLLVAGSYTVGSNFNIVTTAFSSDTGYTWDSTDVLFHVDMTSTNNVMGVSLCYNNIYNYFVLTEKYKNFDNTSLTYVDRIKSHYTYDGDEYTPFNHLITTKGVWNNYVEDSTSTFDYRLVSAYLGNANDLYVFSLFNFENSCSGGQYYGIRYDIYDIYGHSKTGYISKLLGNYGKLADVVKYKDHYLLLTSDTTSKNKFYCFALNTWSNISENIKYDTQYIGGISYPSTISWDTTTAGTCSVSLGDNYIKLTASGTNSKYAYWQNRNNYHLWCGVNVDADATYAASSHTGFVIKTTLRINQMDNTDETQSSGIFFHYNYSPLYPTYIKKMGLFFTPNKIYIKENINDTTAKISWNYDFTDFTDVMFVNIRDNYSLWVKSSVSYDWTNLASGLSYSAISTLSSPRFYWGIINNVSGTTDIDFKEIKYGRVDSTNLLYYYYGLKQFTNPNDLIGKLITAKPTKVYNNLTFSFRGNIFYKGEEWYLQTYYLTDLEVQGRKYNIFNDKQYLKWYSNSDTTDDYLIIYSKDYSYIRLNSISLLNTNLNICYIQGSNDLDNWDATNLLFDTTVISFTELGNCYITLDDIYDVKYIRIYIPQQTTTDGYYKIGYCVFGEEFELDYNPEYSYTYSINYDSPIVKTSFGMPIRTDIGAKLITYNFKFESIDLEYYNKLQNFFDYVSYGLYPFVFVFDNDNIYLVRMSNNNYKVERKIGRLIDINLDVEGVL